jgi:hypothetical protein
MMERAALGLDSLDDGFSWDIKCCTLAELLPRLFGGGQDVAEAALTALAGELHHLTWLIEFSDEADSNSQAFRDQVSHAVARIASRMEAAAELNYRIRTAHGRGEPVLDPSTGVEVES